MALCQEEQYFRLALGKQVAVCRRLAFALKAPALFGRPNAAAGRGVCVRSCRRSCIRAGVLRGVACRSVRFDVRCRVVRRSCKGIFCRGSGRFLLRRVVLRCRSDRIGRCCICLSWHRRNGRHGGVCGAHGLRRCLEVVEAAVCHDARQRAVQYELADFRLVRQKRVGNHHDEQQDNDDGGAAHG